MTTDFKLRYSIGSLFWVVAAIAFPLGLSTAWGVGWSLLICTGTAGVLFAATRRKLFGVAALCYLAAIVLSFSVAVIDVMTHGSYVRWYNERLEKIATDAELVGTAEERVEAVLGPATAIWRGPDETYIDTGKPTPDARYFTTYNYSPYPWFPYAKFQVHCEHGVVQSIELYDD